MWLRAEFNAPQPLFGMELRSHLERSCRDIAVVLEECIDALLEYGMEEEVLGTVEHSHDLKVLSIQTCERKQEAQHMLK